MVSNEHNSELIKPENLYKLESSYGIKVNDEKEERRHIRFDYSMDLLKDNFEKNEIDCDILMAWKWTKVYFENLGYKHEQGSVYSSPREMTDSEILKDLLTFSEELPYLAESFKCVQVTSIGRTYDVTDLANGKAKKRKIRSNQVEKDVENEEDFDISLN